MLINISTIVFAAAIALFCWSCYRRFRLLLLGRSENRFDDISKRIGSVLYYAFGQRCTVSHGYRFGWNHLVLFWSFMILLIANTEFLLEGLFPDYISFSLLPASVYHPLAFLIDIASVLALLAVCIAIIRRLAFPPSYIEARSRDAFIILGLIALLMIAFSVCMPARYLRVMKKRHILCLYLILLLPLFFRMFPQEAWMDISHSGGSMPLCCWFF